MEKSKLIKVFKTLDEEELKLLRKFVRSPYYNTNKEVIALCDYLVKLAPDFEPRKIERRLVYKKISGGKTYVDGKMRFVMTNLLSTLRQFLIQQSYEEKPLNNQLQLLKVYNERNLDQLFQSALKDIRLEIEERPADDQNDFYFPYQIEHSYHAFLMKAQQRDIEPNLQNVSSRLLSFYLINQLRYYTAMLSYQHLKHVDYQLHFEPYVFDYLSKNWEQHEPIIGAYYFSLMTLTNGENEQHYQQLRLLLNTSRDEMPTGLLPDIYVHARNYCIRRVNMMNDVHYLEELFALYQMMLEQDILLNVDGYLSPNDYRNIVVNGARLKEFKWVEAFIEGYRQRLHEQIRDDYYKYCLAQLRFFQKDFNSTRDLLFQMESQDFFISINTRRMLIQTYFELEEDNLLDALLNSFYEFLRRRDFALRPYYSNFVLAVRNLVRVNPFDKQKIKKLKEELVNTRELVSRDWLVEKVEEMI